ncbi:hypothetical protein [Absidia glauca]|uniref:mRNA guanylyltransferase n=1 Tax=Absidia glauca TaxID=4829 RepID=A0A163JLE6_ABSGL|nr:hypothetical protein [Absidia glauca]
MALAQSSAPSSASTGAPSTQQDPLVLLDSIGKRVDPVYSQKLQLRVKELLHSTHSGFPGSQPVPFEAKHLSILEREDYFVCEKSDGLDRNQIWFYVPNVLFPVRGRDNEYLKDTLMDGEIVVDHDENGNKTYRFLIFDLMASNGQSIIQRSFNTRLGLLRQDVIQSYKLSLRTQSDPPPFTMELKKMERSYGLRLVFDQISKLRHSSDGIIWTPVKCPYVPGICEKLLKWKPPEKNTVDFRINAKWSKDHKPIYTLDVLSHLTYKFYDHFQPDTDSALQWKDQPPDGRIAEFRYDPNWQVTVVEQGYAPTTKTGGWRFVRFRDDKDAANEENVVKKILHSIKDGVSKEQLITHMECIRDAWKAREKGLPPPALTHLKNQGRLSISSVSSSSSFNQPMMTPTTTSPVVPSPAANSLSSASGHGYFYGDHNVKSRQNSLDYGSGERRLSVMDANTDSRTEPALLDSSTSSTSSKDNEGDRAATQSLPASRKQSLESSPKRDSNGNDSEETERKRHKSLSELDKGRKIQSQAERRLEEASARVTTTNDNSTTTNREPPPVDEPVEMTTAPDYAATNPSKADTPTTKQPADAVSPSHPSMSHALPTVREEGSVSTASNTRRRKTLASGNDLQERQQQQYVDNRVDMDNAADMQLNKHRRMMETRTATSVASSIKPGSDIVYGNGNGGMASNQHQQEQHIITPRTSTDMDSSKRHGQPQSTHSTPTTSSIQNGMSPTAGQQRNQGNYYTRYDPARSPPPSSSPSSSSSIPRSPHMATNIQLHYGSAPPSSASSSPSSTQAPSSNRKESSHSIHNLLTSSVEPVSYSPKKSGSPSVPTSSGRPAPSTRSYNISSLLHDSTQQKDVNNAGSRQNEANHPSAQVQQQQQQQQYHQMPLERPQAASIPHTSSARTPPVQFINYHAERPRAQDSPTSQQKAVFIQGEYHNSAVDPPTKSRSTSIATANTPPQHLHQWQSSGLETTNTHKNSNHRPSQTSSTTSSPSSSPRDSRHSGSYNVWRAAGNQQQPQQQQQSVPHYGGNPPGIPTNHQVVYPAQAHYYHPQQQHQFQQQQQQQQQQNYSNYDTHPDQYPHQPAHGPPAKYPHLRHTHQQAIRPASEPEEYHHDPSAMQHYHPAYQDMYRPHPSQNRGGQSTAPSSPPPAPPPPPAKDSEKKSDKAKLDFILN